MKEEILINFTPQEIRVAVVESGMLQEIHIERNDNRGIVKNIYLGKVVRVLPGMQAAFVDIGLSKAGFIHARDIGDTTLVKPIDTLLHEGQTILVQVTKDPIGSKSARLTTELALASRYLVYIPSLGSIKISQRIEDAQECDRILAIIQSKLNITSDAESPSNGVGNRQDDGYIVRTAAEGVSEQDLLDDVDYLQRLWQTIKTRKAQVSEPAIVYEDVPLFLRILRDFPHEQVERIRVDSQETYQKVLAYVDQLIPDFKPELEHYKGERPIFDLFSIEEEITKALGAKVPLKSGGYLIIEQTEAMSTVDVNTGTYVGHNDLEDTIYRTNLEAASAIGRQLRLRNLGGLIILDFIDMSNKAHQEHVLQILEQALSKDAAHSHVTGLSKLGLVEMTRKRTRESLNQLLSQDCPTCYGTGVTKTPQTVCYEIFREVLRVAKAFNAANYLVLANQNVIDRLIDEDAEHLAELEQFIGKSINLQVETFYTTEQFDVVLR